MSPDSDRPASVVKQWQTYAALLFIALLMGVTFVVFGWTRDTTKLLVPGIAAALVVVLAGFIFRETVLGSTNALLSKEAMAELTRSLGEQLLAAQPGSELRAPAWYFVDWQTILRDARSVTFFVSYMDTWLNQNDDSLLGTSTGTCA
jgi:hypothetical protein